MVCSKCKDFSICEKGNFKNLISGRDHPIVSDSIIEALTMFSKKDAESVVYSNTEYNNTPNKVLVLNRIITNQIHVNRKKALEK